MKKLIACGIIACLALMAFSYSRYTVKNVPIHNVPIHIQSITYIPLSLGCDYINMFGDLCRRNGLQDSLAQRAFTIPRTDLLGLLGMDTVQCDPRKPFAFARARAYIGYDNATKKFHLVFTPVMDDKTPAGHDTILTDAEGKQIVFDLTTPCPNTCDYTSKLYHAFDKN